MAASWQEPKLTVEAGDKESDFLPVDCFSMNTGSDGPLLSQYARDVLGEQLQDAGEFWPVEVLGYRYWWFNCLASVAALDPARTEAEWGVVDGEWGEFKWITSVQRLAFLPDAVDSAPAVFRIPEFPQGTLFSSEPLARAIDGNRLTGFQLDPVWSQDGGGVLHPSGFDLPGTLAEPDRAEISRKRAQARTTLDRRRAHANHKR